MRRMLNTLYVTNTDAYLRKQDDCIAVFVDNKKAMSVPFHLLEGMVLFGHVSCSTALLGACASHGVRVTLLDERGRYMARVEGSVSGNVLLRREQYRRAADEAESLSLAKRFVAAKLHNQRIVLQHYARDYPDIRSLGVEDAIESLRQGRQDVVTAKNLDELRGVEGNAAHQYYSVFGLLLRTSDEGISFSGRSRRPPKDCVNAALSFAYTLMSRDIASACEAVGLDPQMGFLHACRPGRSSLALDLVEEFRSAYVDRFVLTLFNRKQLRATDFIHEGQGVVFKEKALKRVLASWQERKQGQMTHPFLDDRVKLGLLPFVQAQLLAKYLRGDLTDYPALLWK
ncbi:MAG: type I-C CRISPR-associated endonuclease Cas1c [Coriobacteriales bacterium]|nr:type I-C CRISPR-associated endonuclease Cas1c [Coriobacteriales bacterium]